MMLQKKMLLLAALIHTSGMALASSQSEDAERFGTYLIRCITQPSPQLWRRENLELFLKISPDEGHLAAALELNPSSQLERYIKLLITDRSKFPTDNERRVLLWHNNDCDTPEILRFHSEALRVALFEFEVLKEELDADIRSNSLTLQGIADRSADFNIWLDNNMGLLMPFINDNAKKQFLESAEKIKVEFLAGIEELLSKYEQRLSGSKRSTLLD